MGDGFNADDYYLQGYFDAEMDYKNKERQKENKENNDSDPYSGCIIGALIFCLSFFMVYDKYGPTALIH